MCLGIEGQVEQGGDFVRRRLCAGLLTPHGSPPTEGLRRPETSVVLRHARETVPQLRRSSSSVWLAAGGGSRGRITRERNPCLALRSKEPGSTLPLPAVPREGTARLHAAEEDSRRFQPTTEPRVFSASAGQCASFLVAIAEAGAPCAPGRLELPGVELVNLGLIDTPEKAAEAGHRFRQTDVDLIFLHVTTYALSPSITRWTTGTTWC